MNFICLDRGFSRTMVILPGWAFDFKVFPLEMLSYNIIAPGGPLCGDLSVSLSAFLKERGTGPVDLLGWSLGGISAINFAVSDEQIVNRLILVSVRNSYSEEVISDMTRRVLDNRRRALKRFYLTAFHGQRDGFKEFKRKHLERLLAFWPADKLITALKYLLEHPVLPLNFKRVQVKIIHGMEDRIAPLNSMAAVTSSRDFERFIIKEAGHLPFLRKDFREILESF